jgi:phosphohistidine phosphatase SixA
MRVLALLLSLLAPGVAAADDTVVWEALRNGGHVALIRHADAPGGAGDPPGFRIEDCATQRSLSEKGRAQARALGDRLRAQRISVEKVISSRWCRCRETAELMAVGDVEDAPTFDNAYVLRDRREELTRGARMEIGRWSGAGTLVVVTHGANILALTGSHPGEAEIVVVRPDPQSGQRLRVLGRIQPGP